MRSGIYKLSFAADEALLDSTARQAWAAAGLLALGLMPLLASDYLLYLATLVAINIIAAVGLNILTGFTGLLSIGHGVFMGVGAYAATLAAIHLGLPFWLTIPAGGLAAAAVGVFVGLPSLRIKGLYLAIATLAAQFIGTFVFREWTAVTGGDRGLSVPSAQLLGYSLDSDAGLFCIAAPVAVAMTAFARNLFRTRIGRAFIAVRDRDYSAEVLGIDLLRTKLLSFALSSFYAGIAGGLMAYFFKIVNPEQYDFARSIFLLAAVIVGGLGSIAGSVFGAVFMTLVPEGLKLLLGLIEPFYPMQAAVLLAPIREIVFGLLIVLFLIYEPHGLAEIWKRLGRRAELWPFRT